jgi:hypothetical protein
MLKYNHHLYIYVVYYMHDSKYDNMFARSKDNIQTPSHNYKSLPVQYIYHVHMLCSTVLLFLAHQTVVDPVETNICHTWRPQSLSYFLFSHNEVVVLLLSGQILHIVHIFWHGIPSLCLFFFGTISLFNPSLTSN